jgi:hypothetical protein
MRRVIIESVPSNVYQQGGLTNADMLTGNYAAPSNNPNIEVEGGEHTLNSQTGQVQEVTGKKHVNGGEKINLPDQSKVLSDYTKIGAKNIKIFEEMFDINLKATDTFATVLDKFNKKIGIKKLEEEEKELLKKIEESTKSSIDRTTKKINEDFLAQEMGEVSKKKEALNGLKQQAFATIFHEQEKIPKKGNGSEILDKSGNPIKQEGGVQGQPSPEQIIQAYAQLAGQDPQQVIQQLQQLPPEEQQAALGQMMQALQQGQGQQAAPEEQPQMREGGMYNELPKHQEAKVVAPTDVKYDFSTKYPSIPLPGYEVRGNQVVQKDQLTGVEGTQHYVPGVGYGIQMQPVDKTMATHDWYFNTPEKKEAFRKAVVKKGAQPEVLDFQKSYDEEVIKRGKAAGLSDEQISNIVNDIGFSGEGVRKRDSLFGAYTSSRPLIDFSKTPEEEPIPGVDPQQPQPIRRDVVKNIVSLEGLPELIPPSAPIAPYLQQVNLSRLEGKKGSVENQLQASENARQAAYQATKGLPPAQAAAMMANYLATSGQQDTTGIAQQEMQDLGDKARIEQYNAGQGDKEQILNEQLKKQYEKEAFATLNVNEQNWRNYYDANDANRKALSDKIERRNIMNLGLDNYQLNGNGGFDFVNKSPFQQQAVTTAKEKALYANMTPQEHLLFQKAYSENQGDLDKALQVLQAVRAKKAAANNKA